MKFKVPEIELYILSSIFENIFSIGDSRYDNSKWSYYWIDDEVTRLLKKNSCIINNLILTSPLFGR